MVFPDYCGRAVANGFAGEVATAAPGALVVAVANGPHGPYPPAVEQPGLLVVQSRPTFNHAILLGLGTALDAGAGRIVRLDTAEHPTAMLGQMFTDLGSADVVVADLTFDQATMRPGSADDYHNHFVMPVVHGAATGGKLALSGAHGYMAFTGEALTELLPAARAAVARSAATGLTGGREAFWGVDAILFTLAHRAGMDVRVRHVPASEMRDRPAAKCAEQLTDTLAMFAALDPC